MLKKFGYGLIVVGALIFGVGIVNTAFIGLAKAAEEPKPKEEKCPKCGHLPSKPEGDCKCECHAKKGY